MKKIVSLSKKKKSCAKREEDREKNGEDLLYVESLKFILRRKGHTKTGKINQGDNKKKFW